MKIELSYYRIVLTRPSRIVLIKFVYRLLSILELASIRIIIYKILFLILSLYSITKTIINSLKI